LVRQSVKIRQDVIEAVGFKQYDFKSEVVAQIEDPQYIFDEEGSFRTFKAKAQEVLDVFPQDPRQTVNSFIQKHQEYLPEEMKSLMIATGSVDLTKCSVNDVRKAIEIQVEHCYNLDFSFISLCARAFPSSNEPDKIIDCYFPRIKWQGSTNDFAELMSALRKNNWINTSETSSVRKFSLLCNFHFTIIDNKGKEAKYDAIKKAFDQQQKRIVDAPEKDLILIKHDLKFSPLAIGKFTPQADK